MYGRPNGTSAAGTTRDSTKSRHVLDAAGDVDGDAYKNHRDHCGIAIIWGHHLMDRLPRPAGGREFSLELVDPPSGFGRLGFLAGAQAMFPSLVDTVMQGPSVDHLVTDDRLRGNLGHWPATSHQLQHFAAEIGWIASASWGGRPAPRVRNIVKRI